MEERLGTELKTPPQNVRKPWLAGFLSLLQPGWGHLYCGSWHKAIKFYLLAKLVVFCGVAALLWSPANVLLYLLLVIGFYVFLIQNTINLARRVGPSYILKPYNKWYIYLLVLIVVGVGGGLVFGNVAKNHFAQSYKIPSGAMIPTLMIGDHVTTDKIYYRIYSPERGDIVTFLYPEDETKTFIKRIVGLPGDTIQLRDKMVYINGKLLKDEGWTQRIDPGILDGRITPRDNLDPITVPPDSYFVMGDNRDQSLDSRFWGFVNKDKITGKLAVIYWSWKGEGSIIDWVRWDRIGISF